MILLFPLSVHELHLYYKSFIPSSVRLWNLQPDNVGLSLSIQAFFFLSFVHFCFTTQFFYMKSFHSDQNNNVYYNLEYDNCLRFEIIVLLL